MSIPFDHVASTRPIAGGFAGSALERFNWSAIVAMAALFAVGCWVYGFTVGREGLGGAIALSAGLLLAAQGLRRFPRGFAMLVGLAQVILLTSIAGPLSYVACAANWPIQDAALATLDRAIGYDGAAAARFVDAHPAVSQLLTFGYAMIKLPLLAIPIVLAATGRTVRLQQFIAALAIALILTIAISIAVPAVGVYQSLALAPADIANVDITAFTLGLSDIPAVRNGTLRHIELFSLAGIITFPSFHAASAVLYIWAFAPVRIAAPISAVVNGLMIASTPVVGGHYLVDVVAGIALAFATIAMVKAWSTRSHAATGARMARMTA